MNPILQPTYTHTQKRTLTTSPPQMSWKRSRLTTSCLYFCCQNHQNSKALWSSLITWTLTPTWQSVVCNLTTHLLCFISGKLSSLLSGTHSPLSAKSLIFSPLWISPSSISSKWSLTLTTDNLSPTELCRAGWVPEIYLYHLLDLESVVFAPPHESLAFQTIFTPFSLKTLALKLTSSNYITHYPSFL